MKLFEKDFMEKENDELVAHMKRILVGIVLYNPDEERLRHEILSVSDYVTELCFFDNGSDNFKKIQEMILAIPNICKTCFLSSEENKGIGYALNRIFTYAQKGEYEWVLTLDHDTICPTDLIAAYMNMKLEPDIGMVCPSVVDQAVVRNYWAAKTASETEEVERCIQSGCIVRVSAWEKVKGFDEIMFIDFVDFDFCKRLLLKNYRILRNNSIVIDHKLGEKEQTIYAGLFNRIYKKTGWNFVLFFTYKNVFSDTRAYYASRNNIIYIRRYHDNLHVRKEVIDYLDRMIRKIIRGKNRLRIVYQSLRGLKDALAMSKDEIA